MTQDEIIAMAKEAGMHIEHLPDDYCKDVGLPIGSVSRCEGVGLDELQAFAALVVEKAAAKEREACAQVCESWDDPRDYAAAIRARGQKDGA